MQPLGISRVTDITRLDVLGLPVCASVRPRGVSLRVHAGKGLVLADAMAGALMEALEYAVAEHASARPPAAWSTAEALPAQWPDGLTLADFAPHLGARVAAERRFDCVFCEDLGGGPGALLPAELVLMRADTHDDGPSVFGWTTNGLASGNSVAEATVHALFEVLERDAVALNHARDASAVVDNHTLPEPFRAFAEGWRSLGVALMVRLVPNACALPCFEACLHEPGSLDVNLVAGSGLHVDRDIALARAVCEAAQSRLSLIHGGRDDVTRFYAKYDVAHDAQRQQQEARLLARWIEPARRTAFDAAPHHPAASSSEDALQWLLLRLSQRGFPAVFRHCLDAGGTDLQGLQVVKVVVPRCESIGHDTVRMGPRLLARALGRD